MEKYSTKTNEDYVEQIVVDPQDVHITNGVSDRGPSSAFSTGEYRTNKYECTNMQATL